MKRFHQGYKFPQGTEFHMWSKFDPESKELIIIPADPDWQFCFDFMIGWK